MDKPKIIAYMKPSCGWSEGVRAVMRKYDLPFEDRDIINDPVQRQEMIQKTGQMLQPCVEIDGQMLADVSGEEVESSEDEDEILGAKAVEFATRTRGLDRALLADNLHFEHPDFTCAPLHGEVVPGGEFEVTVRFHPKSSGQRMATAFVTNWKF